MNHSIQIKKFKTKVKARALYLVIFISFISSVILLFFISRNYYTQAEILQHENLKKMVDACNSLINYSLSENEHKNIKLEDIGFKNTSGIEASVNTEYWGGYTISKSKANWHDIKYSKAALIGPYLFQKEKIGLYLSDKGKYLSIAGETELTGNCYLPALGIRSVYIDGKPYKGSELVYGIEKKSTENLPEINKEFTEYIVKAINAELGDSAGNINDIYKKEKINQPFFNKSIIYKSPSAIELDRVDLYGKIIVQSDSLIIVNRSVHLNQIILIAPTIIIEDDFNGNLQAIASDSIFVGEGAVLEYPSMLAVYNHAGNKSFCYISKGASVSGGVFCGASMEDGKSSEVYIQKDAVINGLVYCKGSVMHSGKIIGSLYTNRFILRTARGYYENHLFSAVVDPKAQHETFIVPHLLSGTKKKGVLQWVD